MADGVCFRKVLMSSLLLLLLLLLGHMLEQADCRSCSRQKSKDDFTSSSVAEQGAIAAKYKNNGVGVGHSLSLSICRRRKRRLSSSNQFFTPKHGRARRSRFEASDHEVPSGPNPISNR